MKFFILFLTLLLPLRLLAVCCVDYEEEKDWALAVRGAYYKHTSKAIRRIYPTGWIDYQVEASKRVNDFVEFWTGVYWASKQHGRAHSASGRFRDQTRMYILPLNVGFKLIYPVLPCIEAYIGAGVCYSFLTIRNRCKEQYSCWGLSRSPFRSRTQRSGVGAVFKLGFKYDLGGNVFLDIFADYFSQRFHISRHKKSFSRNIFRHHVDCSGFKFGAGLGVYF
jgi:outer membrane protein W